MLTLTKRHYRILYSEGSKPVKKITIVNESVARGDGQEQEQ